MAIVRIIPAGDLELNSQGGITFIDGPALIRQNLSSRFKWFKGEYFLDLRQGIPYFEHVLGKKKPNLNAISSLFRRVILTTPGVLSLPSYSVAFDEGARSLAFDFEAKVKGGSVRVNPSDRDFLVTPE